MRISDWSSDVCSSDLLADGEMLRARLVIAADGAGSRVRELLNVTHERRDYAQSAIVTAVRTRRPHRGCAYERFTPDGPIALLPKGDEVNCCSLVWTTPAEQIGRASCRERVCQYV